MAYSSSVAAAVKILDLGFTASPSTGAGISGGGSVYRYCSSDATTAIHAVAGYFTGCGAQPKSSTGTPHPNLQTRALNNIGMRPGDAVLIQESSAGNTPGRTAWGTITASTWSGSTSVYTSSAGYDCTCYCAS